MRSSQTKVRLHPGKFWSATKMMSNEEREELLRMIAKLAELGDYDGLVHFDFITLDRQVAA